MPRAENVFYNLVTDENSTTELLCNLMRFSGFRIPFLRLFLPEAVAKDVAWEDFDTQLAITGGGRPDLQIWNDDIVALIEIKVSAGLPPTPHQRRGYFELLRKQAAPERWLVFLVPRNWAHQEELNRELAELAGSAGTGKKIGTCVILWNDVIEVIEKNDLAALSPFLKDFHELLVARFAPTFVAFTDREIQMLFSHEIPSALARLQKIVDSVRDRNTIGRVKPSASRTLCPSEYGLYFLDEHNREFLWFGVWTDFWEAQDAPLCFGVHESTSPAVQQAFMDSFPGQKKHFDKYIVGWFGHEVLSSENAIDEVWAALGPILEATFVAHSKEPAPNPAEA
jgi:hypothetical protein